MINRRTLLKLFSAGATIAPISGAEPIMEAAAKIVEPPKVELIEKPLDEAMRDFLKPDEVLVDVMDDHGRRVRLKASKWNIDFKYSVPSPRSLAALTSMTAGPLPLFEWKMYGISGSHQVMEMDELVKSSLMKSTEMFAGRSFTGPVDSLLK